MSMSIHQRAALRRLHPVPPRRGRNPTPAGYFWGAYATGVALLAWWLA